MDKDSQKAIGERAELILSLSTSMAEYILDTLNYVSNKLISESSQEFIRIIPETVCQLLLVNVCVLWKFDEEDQKFAVVSYKGEVSQEYLETELDLDSSLAFFFERNETVAVSNINDIDPLLTSLKKLNQGKWLSLLSAPLKVKNKVIGILNVHVDKPCIFLDWQKKVLKRLANYTALSFQKDETSRDRDKLQTLSNTMLKMTEASDPNQLWGLLREGALELVGSKQVWVAKLNYHTGELIEILPELECPSKIKIFFGKGITGIAMKEEKPINIGDILISPMKEAYIKIEKNSRSELAVPILIERIPIRKKSEVKSGSKVIGVLNIESPIPYAFSEIDQERIWLLARYAASRFEQLEQDSKLLKLRNVEKELTDKSNTKPKTYEEIITIVIEGITEILGFQWVNISLVDQDRNQIKSEFVFVKGWTEDRISNFKRKAIHDLNSEDIQADIIRNREIEVPEVNDPRFDPDIFEKFEHEKLLRVYVPMVSPLNNSVIGTVEAGYNPEFRKYIFEQDVQVLKSFVDSAVHALERKKSGIIDTISHELKSPIIGIRNNASFLQRRANEVTTDRIRIKCEDILSDCDSLLYQVRQIEYFMGKSAFQKLKIEKTFVFRDIIIKTVNQLKSTAFSYGFPVEKIEYDKEDARKIYINTDKIKLGQVVYNLLINSLRYAEKDPREFRIKIEVADDRETFTIKFKDWGMGIKSEDKDKIFEEGFRSQEARKKDVRGSGLGLSISKRIMKQLGGDLTLNRFSKPTEFYVMLPKNLEMSEQ